MESKEHRRKGQILPVGERNGSLNLESYENQLLRVPWILGGRSGQRQGVNLAEALMPELQARPMRHRGPHARTPEKGKRQQLAKPSSNIGDALEVQAVR